MCPGVVESFGVASRHSQSRSLRLLHRLMRIGGGRRQRYMQRQCAVAGHGCAGRFVNEAGAKQSGALEVLWKVGLEHVSPVRSFVSFQGQWPKPPDAWSRSVSGRCRA
jgi:hypothetical protein